MRLFESDTWILWAILAGVIAVLALGAFLVGLPFGGGADERSRNAAFGRTEAFFAALRDQRRDDATAMFADAAGTRPSAAIVAERVREAPVLTAIGTGHFRRYRRTGGSAVVSGTISSADEHTQVGFELHMVRAADDWQITELVLGGRPLLAR